MHSFVQDQSDRRKLRAGGLPGVVLLCAVAGWLWLAAAPVRAVSTVVAVGDIACDPADVSYNGGAGTSESCRQRYVSDTVVGLAPDALLVLGDNQYARGELANYQAVYGPTFGRANAVVYPSLGNAEYDTAGAQGFFDYFSGAGVTARLQGLGAGASMFATGGYYSFDVGGWHLIALNSNCAEVGGCGAGSAQAAWLREDLAAHPRQCTLAYWHHPRWNTGRLGNDASTAAFWTALYNANADLVLNGHGNHHYERFKPQDPTGTPDPGAGIREFIVSTGGESHGTPPASTPKSATSEVSDYASYGVLKLTLRADGYDWQFIPEVGGGFSDSGTGTCHAVTSTVPAQPTVQAAAGDGAAHLTWTPPANGGAAVTGYRIYRGTSAGGETLLDTVAGVQAYDDYTAINGTAYSYRVAAVNVVGEGGRSNAVTVTPAAAPGAGFPTTPVLDDFLRSAGALGTDWKTPGLADAGTVTIVATGRTASGNDAATAEWNTTAFPADQEAYLTVPALPADGDHVQLAARVSGSGSTLSAYLLRVTPATTTWDLRRKQNGALSTSVKTFKAPFSAGDALGLRLQGSTITVLYKPAGHGWRSVGSASSTAITAGGRIAFTLGDTTARGGAFGGGATATPTDDDPPVIPAAKSPESGPADVPPAPKPPAGTGGGGQTGGGPTTPTPTTTPGTPATTKPATLKITARRLRAALAKGLTIRVTNAKPGTTKLKARAGKTLVATGKLTVKADGTGKATLRFTAKAKRSLKKKTKVTLKITGAGATQKVTLKR